MVFIAPSLLSCDFKKMGEELIHIQNAGADYAHLDVMDGHFVTNLTFGLPVIQSLKEVSCIPFDVHLMIEEPLPYIARYANAGADIITVHYEACRDLKKTLEAIRLAGKKAGLSIKPGTPVDVIYPYLNQLDWVLIMTVEPGYGGQKMIPACLDKVKELKKHLTNEKKSILIEVDGGVDINTAPLLIEAGADILVAGTAVFGASDRKKAIEELKKC